MHNNSFSLEIQVTSVANASGVLIIRLTKLQRRHVRASAGDSPRY